MRDTMAKLFARHAEVIEAKSVLGASSLPEVNQTLRRVERFWTDQIRYIY
jgi:hypothetical protein